ncbi:MAG: hypothetical protein ABIH11_01930 [Candidatus Altiarchaeota archaeon]
MPKNASAGGQSSGRQQDPDSKKQDQVRSIDVSFTPEERRLVDYGDGKADFASVRTQLNGIAARIAKLNETRKRITALAGVVLKAMDKEELTPNEAAALGKLRERYAGSFRGKDGAELPDMMVLMGIGGELTEQAGRNPLSFPEDHAIRHYIGERMLASVEGGRPLNQVESRVNDFITSVGVVPDPRAAGGGPGKK